MIAATLYAMYLLFFSSGHEQFGVLMEQYVKDQMNIVILDEPRREMALKSLAIVKDDITDLNKLVTSDDKQLEKLIKDYHSRPEQFDQLFSSALNKRQALTDKLWDDRQAMLTHIEAGEWKSIMRGAMAEAEKKKSKGK